MLSDGMFDTQKKQAKRHRRINRLYPIEPAVQVSDDLVYYGWTQVCLDHRQLLVAPDQLQR
jgi:hypothetical protein